MESKYFEHLKAAYSQLLRARSYLDSQEDAQRILKLEAVIKGLQSLAA